MNRPAECNTAGQYQIRVATAPIFIYINPENRLMDARPPDDVNNELLLSEIEEEFGEIRSMLAENDLPGAADSLCDIYDIAPYNHFKEIYQKTLDLLEDHMVRMIAADVTSADPSPLLEPADMIRYTSPDMDDDLFFDLINRIRPHIESTNTIRGCVDTLNLMNALGRCMFSVETFLPKMGGLCSRMNAICDATMNKSMELDDETPDGYIDAAIILIRDVKSFYSHLGNSIEEIVETYDNDILESISDRWDDDSERPYLKHIDDAYLASVSLNHVDEAADSRMLARRDYNIILFIKTYLG